LVEGRPFFVRKPGANVPTRLGLFATRWVRAPSREKAEVAACRLIEAELSALGNLNPPEEPLSLWATEVARRSWLDWLRHWRAGRGWSLFPDEGQPAGQ